MNTLATRGTKLVAGDLFPGRVRGRQLIRCINGGDAPGLYSVQILVGASRELGSF